MNTFLFAIIAMHLTSNASFAQNGMGKGVIHTPGVMAEVCKTSIENFLMNEYGVSSVKSD